jgi:hypothetical protein
MNKDEHLHNITNYFSAFATGYFAAVRFSPYVEFLSPLSGDTFKGKEDVVHFLHNVTTRITKVEILSITVDYTTASGVWQMTTSKGLLYTLNNFFRLDSSGLLYIWPMFDPKAVMDDPAGLIQWLTGTGY